MLTAALAGCAAVGPDYRTPADAAVQRPDAQAPFLESHGAAYRQDAPPGRWWRLYDDPALDGLVEQALAANTDLRVAAANLERAQAATREAQAQQQPSVGVNASPTFGHVSGLQGCSRASIPSRWSTRPAPACRTSWTCSARSAARWKPQAATSNRPRRL